MKKSLNDSYLDTRLGFHKINLALAFGILSAAGLFFLGLASWLFDWGTGVVLSVSSLYLGYDSTFIGSIIGAIWGFIDGFIGGLLFAMLYNFFQRKKYFKDL